VREPATVLCNIPIKEYQLIGQYYLVWCNCRESVFKAEALENLAGQTRTYKAKVLLSRAAIDVYQHKMETALYFYNEALRTSPAISEYISLTLGFAQIKGIEGFHESALKDMENLIPIIRYAEPRLFFDMLNSYATELSAVGRLYEARNVSRVVLASPFIHAYPEWQETVQELKPANRSFMAIGSARYNVLTMPEREPSKQGAVEPKPARVLDLAKWKKKMVKESDDNDTSQPLEDMTPQDMAMKLLELITENRYEEDKIRKVLEHALETFSEPRKPVS
jgi:tetratricopeptide (TPR) repeat protein